MNELLDQLVSFLRAAWYYRWYSVLTAWLIAGAGWTAIHFMPDRYEADARVYVDTQTMLRPLLSGLAVQPNIDQVVAMMSRTLISRVNLEKVVKMSGMNAEIDSPEQRELMIEQLAKNLSVKSTGRENLFAITYSDHDRERAKRVVQSLLTIFVEGSLGDKRRDSDAARQFIEEQLRSYSQKLVAAENAVTEFKRKHQGLMPSEGRDSYGRLQEARDALRQAALDLKEAENARDALKRQLEGEARSETSAQGNPRESPAVSELDLRIRTLEQKLDGLRLNYTEQHPDIVALTRMIEQLKEEKTLQERTDKAAMDRNGKNVRPPQGKLYEQLVVQLAAAEAHVAALRARVAEYQTRQSELQATANALPQVEAEYKQLTRDYEVIRSRYDKLLERREQAQISGDVEASEAVMGFRVIDPPQVPLEPSAPKRSRLMTIVLALAIMGALGVAFLMSQLMTTFGDERRLRESSGLRVLGSVAMSWNERQERRRARGRFALVMSYACLFAVYGVIMSLHMLSTAGS